MPYVTVGKESSKDIEIYYKDWGSGQPVVFSHGWPLSADAWEDQMFYLSSRGYRCIAHGRIINIGSVNSDLMPFAGGSVYALTKGAVASFTRGLARDLGPRGITVNNIQPGPVDTDMNPADGPFAETLKGLIALGRYGRGDEVAAMVSYIASPAAAFVTGASLKIDGGFAA